MFENTIPKGKNRFNKFLPYILFIVWPFFALCFSIVNHTKSYAKNIVWLFTAFFGFTFVITDDGIDSSRYRDWMIEYHALNITYSDFINRIAEGTHGRNDYFEPLMAFTISRFTDDYRYLFLLYGLVFGYFYSRCIWFMIDRMGGKMNKFAIPVMTLFVFLDPIWNINGIRFWTATLMFIYSVFQIVHNKKNWYVLLSLSSILVHFSFAIPNIILILYIIIGQKKWVYFALFIATLFFIKIDLIVILKYLPQVSGVLEDRLSTYTNKDTAEVYFKTFDNRKWFMRWNDKGILFLSIGIITWLGLFKFNELKKLKLDSLFLFGVLIFSLVNLLESVPIVARFYSVSYFAIYGTLFLFIQYTYHHKWVKLVSIITIFPITLYIIVSLRMGIQVMGVNALISNPLIVWFLDNDMTLLN